MASRALDWKDAEVNTLDIARRYLERGWHPVPYAKGTKAPTNDGWQKRTITPDNVAQFFNGSAMNIGLQLGPKSGGLADVDLDCTEAVALADYFLPETRAIFGRKSKPRSHFLFLVSDPDPAAVIKYADGEKHEMVGLRLGGGGKGAQTMAPGSTHPEGETVEWNSDGEPGRVGFAALKAAVQKIAAGTLLLRAWPTKGGRHEAAMRLGGFLARVGWEPEAVGEFVSAVAREAGDDEVEDRRKAALDAAEMHARDGKGYGFPALQEYFGEEVAKQVFKVLGFTEMEAEASLERMNERFCVVPVGNKTRILTFEKNGDHAEPVFFGSDDFKLLFDNQRVGKVGLGAWWLKHRERRQYVGLTFDPGAPSEVEGRLNLWRGWGVLPQAGKWPLMRRHIKDVLANGVAEHAAYILNWTAWAVQNPSIPAEVAVVLRGGRGAGKGVYGRALRRLFGQHGRHISSADHLTGRFNKHLLDCAFLFADEAYWPGNKSAEGTLKRIITEPTLTIEPKGIDVIEVLNRLKVVMAANDVWVVPAGIDERRFAIFNVAETHKQERAYFDPLYRELDGGGLAAMLFDLLKMDLKGWHPRQDIPKSDALREQQMLSLSHEDQWWLALLNEGTLPSGGVERNPRRAGSHELFRHARETVPGLKFASDHRLGRILRSWGCRPCQIYGGAKRAWDFPPLAEARARWDAQLPTDWGDDFVEWQMPDGRGVIL